MHTKSSVNGLSICSPVFKTARYLKLLVQSIQDQVLPEGLPYEILLGCDGGPAEDLSEALQCGKAFKKVRVFRSTVNRGKFIMENTLVTKARYSGIVFMDSDDHFCETKALSTVLDKYLPGNDIVAFSLKNYNAEGFASTECGEGDIIRAKGGNFFVYRDVFMNMNGFPAWRCRADGPFHTRAEALGYRTSLTEEVLVSRVLRPDSLLHDRIYGSGTAIRERYKVLEKEYCAEGKYIMDEMVTNSELEEVL